MNTINIKISGMTCDHCAQGAQDALNTLEGVQASVSYAEGVAKVDTTGTVDNTQLLKAIEAKGYSATLASNDNQTTTGGDGSGLHIAIVGTGSGAFAAAIKAAEQGARVTIVEGGEVIGGTCVNIGCVPSKIFIRGASIAHLQGHHAVKGVALNTPAINRKAMVQQQQQWVEKLRYAKYESILETNPGINLVRGMARFRDAGTLIVRKSDGSEKEIKADRILLATGASASIPYLSGLQDTPYWTSTQTLVAEEIPQHLIVLGASVVFTDPQVATVGLTEQQARKEGLDVQSRTLDLENVPRALANMDTRGFIKLVAETESGRIVGCQVLAHEGGEIIQTAVLAIRNHMSIEELADQLFPYLTMVEGLKLTAQTFNKDVKQLSCCAG